MATALLVAGCGGSQDPADETDEEPAAPAATQAEQTDGQAQEPAKERERKREPPGTEIVLGDSEFGAMLFDTEDQAIYIFELDGRGPSRCYGECADAWPPVFTRGEPVAGKGVQRKLLGTTKRDDGKLQVTYDGQPLYYYAHEAPGEVRCHNVNLNGGLWWVVGADGERLP